MNKYRAKVYLGPQSGYSNIDVTASTSTEAVNQLKTIYNAKHIVSLQSISPSSYPNFWIIPFVIVLTIIINYTSILFAVIFGVFTFKLIKTTSLFSILTILIFMFVGFQIGEYVHYKYFSSPVQKVAHDRLNHTSSLLY